MTSAVRFADARKHFSHEGERVNILNGISGTVETGQLVMIVGPSGSGKSTLLSLCNLLLTPDDGQVYINEKEVRDWDISDLRRTVGLAFQSAPMIDGTVEDNLKLVTSLHGSQQMTPEALMETIGLPVDLLHRDARDLSGGQKQRLSLARTLSNGSSILLLDEITSALDPAAVSDVESLIQRLHKEKQKTILWVSHHLDQARRLADVVWYIEGGKLIEAADTKSFFESPKHESTKAFLQGVQFS